MIHYRGGSKVGYRASVDYQALNWIGFGMIGGADSWNNCGNNPASEGADEWRSECQSNGVYLGLVEHVFLSSVYDVFYFSTSLSEREWNLVKEILISPIPLMRRFFAV